MVKLNKISELTLQQQSLLFAKISNYSYLPPEKSKPIFKDIGFNCIFYSNKGSDVYYLTTDFDIVVVCRGTQPTQMSDIAADLRIALVNNEVGNGEVHKGFQISVNKVWERVSSKIKMDCIGRNLYFTGHSLGAAMATIMTMRSVLDKKMVNPSALFTFGSPRVGDTEFSSYMQSLKVSHYRWVNNADVVTRVPTRPYKHHGELFYMNHDGDVVEMSHWQIIKDRVRGFLKGLTEFNINFFVNHSIDRYVKNLEKWNNLDKGTQ